MLDRISTHIAKRILRFVLLGVCNIVGITSVAGIPIAIIVDALFVLLMLNDIRRASLNTLHAGSKAISAGAAATAEFANNIKDASSNAIIAVTQAPHLLLKTCNHLPMGIADCRDFYGNAENQFIYLWLIFAPQSTFDSDLPF